MIGFLSARCSRKRKETDLRNRTHVYSRKIYWSAGSYGFQYIKGVKAQRPAPALQRSHSGSCSCSRSHSHSVRDFDLPSAWTGRTREPWVASCVLGVLGPPRARTTGFEPCNCKCASLRWRWQLFLHLGSIGTLLSLAGLEEEDASAIPTSKISSAHSQLWSCISNSNLRTVLSALTLTSRRSASLGDSHIKLYSSPDPPSLICT